MRNVKIFQPACLAVVIAGAAISGVTAWAFAIPPKPMQPPRRVVSLNMCADQLVLELADRDQIAGLTRNVTNVEMSAEAAKVGQLHVLGNSAEEILAINPDLVVGMPARRSPALAVLKGQHYKALDLKSAESLAQIESSIREIAAALGHPERGEAMIARMQAELAHIPRPGAGKVAAYYQRRGYLTGTGTLIDELMRRVGLVNLAGKLGKAPLSQLSLEELVAARPDYIIVESATDRVTDQGTEMLHHPALRDIPRISIPQAWTVCGTRAYVLAAQSMAEQIQQHR